MMPIVLDTETSGLDIEKCGIWQIGAVDLNDIGRYCLIESRIDGEDIVEKGALDCIGKTEEYLRNPKKQSQKEMLLEFSKWMRGGNVTNVLVQNPAFDVAIIDIRSKRYEIKRPIHYSAFDLHSIAQSRFYEVSGEFLFKDDHSDMGLKRILEFCGMEDNRKAHNALEDAKLTGECFYRLTKGKSLFPEYMKYAIPGNLRRMK